MAAGLCDPRTAHSTVGSRRAPLRLRGDQVTIRPIVTNAASTVTPRTASATTATWKRPISPPTELRGGDRGNSTHDSRPNPHRPDQLRPGSTDRRSRVARGVPAGSRRLPRRRMDPLDTGRELVRTMLRDHGAWCRLEAEERFFVHIGYDQYMYLGSDRSCARAVARTRALGLFPRRREISPYDPSLDEPGEQRPAGIASKQTPSVPSAPDSHHAPDCTGGRSCPPTWRPPSKHFPEKSRSNSCGKTTRGTSPTSGSAMRTTPTARATGASARGHDTPDDDR